MGIILLLGCGVFSLAGLLLLWAMLRTAKEADETIAIQEQHLE